MLVADAVLRIKRDFIDEYDVIINNSDIYGWIYESELDIIRRVGSNDSNTDTTLAAFPSSVPTSVTIKRISINGRALEYMAREEIDENDFSSEIEGGPRFWYMVNKSVNLWPIPISDLTTAVRITYNKTPTLMVGLPSANTFTVPESYHTDIINYCLSRAFSKSGVTSKVQEYMELYDRNIGMRASEAQAPDAPIYKQNDPLDFNEYSDW